MARYEVARQRDEYGGTNWGAGFFGWLVAVGLGALLTALVTAAGAAIGFSEIESVGEAANNSETIGIVGAICLIAVALISYFAGGYVAGRMSRFDGARQGAAAWAWGIFAVIVLAVIGAIAGSEYNLFGEINLPRIPIDEGDITTGGIITLALILGGTLLAAILGGKAGERYHRRVDETGYVAEREVVADDRVVDRDADGVDDRVEARRRFSPRDRVRTTR
jgi:hypothetical protein